ncbi:methyltransferase domain-containing, partial [Olea europaea subsp. europaea]
GAHRLQRYPNIRFQVADAQAADFEPECFDAILCSNGLLYMADVPGAVSSWASWLRPGGKLCFNTPQAHRMSEIAPLSAWSYASYHLLLASQASSWKYTEPFLKAAQAEGLWLEDPAKVIGDHASLYRVLRAAGFLEEQVQ